MAMPRQREHPACSGCFDARSGIRRDPHARAVFRLFRTMFRVRRDRVIDGS